MVGGEKFGCGTIKRTSLPPLTSSKSGPLKTRVTSEQLATKLHFNTISLGQSERFGEIESVGSDESQLDFAQRSDGLRTARTFQLNAILIGCSRTKKFRNFTTEGLLLSGGQVHDATSGGFVGVVAHTGALVVDAGETVAFQQLLVRFASKSREMAAGSDGIGEELVSSSMIAQAASILFS